MLVCGGEDGAVGDHGGDGGDVIEAGYQDFAFEAGCFHGCDGTEGHGVVGTEDGFETGVFAEHGCGDLVGFFNLPLAGLNADNFHSGFLHCVLETLAALDAVEGGWHAFDDGDLVPF